MDNKNKVEYCYECDNGIFEECKSDDISYLKDKDNWKVNSVIIIDLPVLKCNKCGEECYPISSMELIEKAIDIANDGGPTILNANKIKEGRYVENK